MLKKSLVFTMIMLVMIGILGVNHSMGAEKVILESFPDLRTDVMRDMLKSAGLADVVEIREVPQNEYENQVKMKIGAGEIGDIICIDAPNIAYYASVGAIEPLNTYWDAADFDDLVGSAKAAMQWQGKIWASPFNESNVVLYYNKAMFEKAGLTAPTKVEEAWTFEQLLDAAKKLTQKDAKGNITTYGILPAMFTPNNRNEGMTYTQMLWTWWAGADILSPDGTTVKGYFDSENNKKALQFYYDLHNTYKVAPAQDITGGFEAGKIAMWITGPWMVGIWDANFPDFKGKWGAMPLPHDKAFASPSGSWNLSITKNSKNKELAWKVVQTLTGKEGSKVYCVTTGNLPARKSILTSEKMFSAAPPFDIINEQLMSNARPRPVTPVYPQISEAVMDCYNALAFGENVDGAMGEAVKKMERALSRAK